MKFLLSRRSKIHFVLLIIFLPVLFCNNGILAQGNWNKWQKTKINYIVEVDLKERDYSYENLSVDGVILKSAAILYWSFFSDLDGDNCPFHPSCSNFFIESSRQTNLVQGTLMFFDRFTRDASFAGRHKHYPLYINGKFYDPPGNYTLNPEFLHYHFPMTLIIKEE
jgi:putative component of membrane protein insertase Oxa1/YidC/SpoIIIJ protein YidD